MTKVDAAEMARQNAYDNWTHPIWCEKSECRDSSDGMEHSSYWTAWEVAGDDVRLTMRLVRPDFPTVKDGRQQDRTDAKIELSLLNTASANLDGSPIFADVHLTVADAQTLMQFLQQHVGHLTCVAADIEVAR